MSSASRTRGLRREGTPAPQPEEASDKTNTAAATSERMLPPRHNNSLDGSLLRVSADELQDRTAFRRLRLGGAEQDPDVAAPGDLHRFGTDLLVLESLAERLGRGSVAAGKVLVGVKDQERRQVPPHMRQR